MKRYVPHFSTRGISLTELLVSIAISGFLLFGLVNVFMGAKTVYNVQESLSRLQENGRFVNYLMQNDLRMVGLLGCTNMSSTTAVNLITSPPTNSLFTPDTVVVGHDGSGSSWTPALPSWLTSKIAAGTSIAPGTDVIVIRKLEAQNVHLQNDMSSESDPIALNDRISFKPNDILFISDCELTHIFRASGGTTSTNITHTTSGNTTANFGKAFQTDAQIGYLQTIAYYVKNTGRTNNNGLPIFSLYRQDINGNEDEVIEGLENMQITYGVDTDSDGSANVYQTASTINTNNTWGQVVSINVRHLLTTTDEINPQVQRYVFEGNTITPSDRRLRREWNSFITLRNRSP